MRFPTLPLTIFCFSIIVFSGCSYYTQTPASGIICKSHGRSYVNHFVDVSGSKNRGAYFTRDTLQFLLDDQSINGVSVFIGCEDTVHPLIMEAENNRKDSIKLKGSKKCYLSSAYVTHTCFNKKDGNCKSINNYSNEGKCEVTGAYFPKKVVEEILKCKEFSGLVVYIGLDAANHYPLIMQGTKYKPGPSEINISSTYSIVSKTYCPRACGSL